MEEEEVLEKITKLLEQGCTMLATHHSCGAPLFRCKGEIICPVCPSLEAGKDEPETITFDSREKLTSAEVTEFELAETKIADSIRADTNRKIGSDMGIHNTKQGLKVALIHKLEDFQIRMNQEKDFDQVYWILKCIGEILNILKTLE